MSAAATSFAFLSHPNTLLGDFCVLVLPFIYAEGGRMRWGACFVGMFLYCSLGISSSLWIHMGDLVNSSKVGMASALAFGTLSRTGFFPIGRILPKPVSAGIGAGYFSYHAFWYYRAVNHSFIENIHDDEE